MAKTINDGKKAAKAGSGNPTKKLKKIAKPKSVINARMLLRSLRDMPAPIHKDGGQGQSLQAIRNYIELVHGVRLYAHRANQTLLKFVLEREFERGRIDMVNHDGKLNFTKRFAVAPDVDENEMDDDDETGTESMSSGDDEE